MSAFDACLARWTPLQKRGETASRRTRESEFKRILSEHACYADRASARVLVLRAELNRRKRGETALMALQGQELTRAIQNSEDDVVERCQEASKVYKLLIETQRELFKLS